MCVCVCVCVCVISLDCKLQPGSRLSVFSFSMSIPEKILNANLLNELRYVSHLSKQNLDSFLYLVLYFAFFFFPIQCQPFLTFEGFFENKIFNGGMLSHQMKSCVGNPLRTAVWDHFHSFPYNPSLEVEFLGKGPEHFFLNFILFLNFT